MTVFLDASSSVPLSAVEAIKQHGCFVLRNAISPEELKLLHHRCLEYFKFAAAEGAHGVAHRTGLPVEHVSGHVEGAQKRGVTHHSVLSWYLYGNPSKLERQFAGMLASTRIRRFVEPILGSCILHTNNLAIRYRDVGRSDLALPFHQDSFYFEPEILGPDTVMLVIWVPFTDCDEDTPGLELVPQRITEGIGIRSDPRTQFKHLEADVPDDLSTWYPHLKRGDCIIFAERTLHRSYNADVKHARTSVDLRVYREGRYPKSLNGHSGIRLSDMRPIPMYA
jgi:ectoine hydroxylase-related dioxygenase (phytanoyl-CoA dioxygenase family)